MREVHHPHSDSPTEGIHVLCYPFEEVFAEKIRALAERERPRDLYDVIHLYRHSNEAIDRPLLVQTLEKKCAFKGIPLPSFDTLASSPEYDELRSEWENMLAHQLPILPPFEQFWNELPDMFNWLYGKVEKVAQPVIPSIGIPGDGRWRAPIMATAWHTKVPIEVIRYAGTNRLCVDLQYQGSKRLIEPYSLRRSREGNLLLYAAKHISGEPRAYRVDRIEGATATNKPFTPRYTIEFSESGPFSAPPISRNPEIYRPPKTRNPLTIGFGSRRLASGYGPKYIFECPICEKKFTHKSYDASLRPHKDKDGYPCGGRLGIYIDTK